MKDIRYIEENYMSMSNNEFSQEILERRKLIEEMVGNLYPSILKDEIDYIFTIHRKKMMNEPLYLPDFQI